MRKRYDPWSIVVITLTLLLFVAAVFITGMTHDLLLEAGVFLVSVKLIIVGHKNSIIAMEMESRLEQIHSLLRSMQEQPRV
jgi:hypothetical protein